jgi:dolichol kinase
MNKAGQERPSPGREEQPERPPGPAGTGPVGLLRSWWPRLYDLPFWARETIRKTLHIGVVVLAVPLRWLDWKYGLLFAAVSMFWNSFGMPRYFPFTLRDEEKEAGFSRGMLSYPVIVFALMILFPLPIAVSQWATLSFGDGFATLAGRFFGKRTLPWNRDKTWLGTFAFIVMGSLGATVFFWLTLVNAGGSSFLWQHHHLLTRIHDLDSLQILIVCFLSTTAAAFFESLPIPHIDDNVAAPLAGAVTKLLLCYIV